MYSPPAGTSSARCPALVYAETDVEDVDTDGEDHIYDELPVSVHGVPRGNADPQAAGAETL